MYFIIIKLLVNYSLHNTCVFYNNKMFGKLSIVWSEIADDSNVNDLEVTYCFFSKVIRI